MDTFAELFNLQKKLQSRLCGGQELPKEMPEKIPMQVTALVGELGEILEENQKWKSWRKNPPEVDYDNLLVEIADAFHFLINIALYLGFDADDVYSKFINKNKKNHVRQDNLY